MNAALNAYAPAGRVSISSLARLDGLRFQLATPWQRLITDSSWIHKTEVSASQPLDNSFERTLYLTLGIPRRRRMREASMPSMHWLVRPA